MNMLCLLFAQVKSLVPARVDLPALLTKLSAGVIVLGAVLLIFYAGSQLLRGKHHRRSRGRSVLEDPEQDLPEALPPPAQQHRHHRRRHHSHREGRRNPTLKESGGLPPLRPEGTPPA